MWRVILTGNIHPHHSRNQKKNCFIGFGDLCRFHTLWLDMPALARPLPHLSLGQAKYKTGLTAENMMTDITVFPLLN